MLPRPTFALWIAGSPQSVLVEKIHSDEGLFRVRDALRTCHLAATALLSDEIEDEDRRLGVEALAGHLELARAIADRIDP